MVERTSNRTALWGGLAAGLTIAAVIGGLVYVREHRSAEYPEPQPYPATGPTLPPAVTGPTETITVAPPAPAPRSFFPAADWLWNPIGPDPALAPDSATWSDYLSDPSGTRVTP